jgi:hypothetical protein
MVADSLDPGATGRAAWLAFNYLNDPTLGREACSTPRGKNEIVCRIYLLEGERRYTEELAALDSVMKTMTDARQQTLTRILRVGVLARMNRMREARSLALRVERDVSGGYYREDVLAAMWASVGDADRAFFWLERAQESRSGGIAMMGLQWQRFGVRTDPRIAAFLRANSITPRVASSSRP